MRINSDKYNYKEEQLYSKLFEALEWEVDENYKILKDGFINFQAEKPFIKYRRYHPKEIKALKEKYHIFRPLRVFKHSKILLDQIYSKMDNVQNITIQRSDEGEFQAIVDYTDHQQFVSKRFKHENECRFNLCYFLLFGTEADRIINKVNQMVMEEVEVDDGTNPRPKKGKRSSN